MTLAEHGEHILAAEPGNELGFRAGRLDHLDFRIDAVVREREVFGTYAIDDRSAVGQLRRPPFGHAERQTHTGGTVESRAAVETDGAGKKVHGRGANEACHEQV